MRDAAPIMIAANPEIVVSTGIELKSNIATPLRIQMIPI